MEQNSQMETTLPEKSEALPATGEIPSGVAGIASVVATQHGAGTEPAQPGNGNVAGNALPQKRKGRPPTHGLYSKANGSNGKNPVRPALPGEPGKVESVEVETRVEIAALIPEDLQRALIKETIIFAENWGLSKIESPAIQCGLTSAEISPELKAVALPPEKKDALARLAPLACKELGFDLNVSPLGAIAVLLGPNVLAGFAAFSKLTKLAEEKVRKENGK